MTKKSKSFIGLITTLFMVFGFSQLSAKDNKCNVEITTDDNLAYNLKEIVVPESCGEVSVTLKHLKVSEGLDRPGSHRHNFVLAKTEDAKGVVKDGIKSGAKNEWVKPGDSRIIAHTRILGNELGEDKITFNVKGLKGQDLTFFCSVVGHYKTMHGKFIVN